MASKMIKSIKKFFSKIRKFFRRNKKVAIVPSAKAETDSTLNVWNPAKTSFIADAHCSESLQLNAQVISLTLLKSSWIILPQTKVVIFSPYEQICMLFETQYIPRVQPKQVVFQIDSSKSDARMEERNKFLDLQESTENWCLEQLFQLQESTVTNKKAIVRVKRSRANRRKTLVAQPDLSCLNGDEMDDCE
jgi:hypothetical protein